LESPIGGHRGRVALAILIVAWGLQAIVTQSLLLREALVLMFGSEFAWGVVLFAWLLGVAVGSLIGGRIARWTRRPEIALTVVLVLLSLTACLEILLFRGGRSVTGLQSGELLPLAETVVIAAVLVSPCSALVGMAFPLACSIRPELVRPAQTKADRPPTGVGPLGSVYALESAGSLIGGAAFSFWAVERFSPISIAMLCGALSLGACAGFLAWTCRRRRGGIGLGVAGFCVIVLAALTGPTLNSWLLNLRWKAIAPGFTCVAEVESRYQNLAVLRLKEWDEADGAAMRETGGDVSLYSDGKLVTSYPDPFLFIPLAHIWMCQHPSPQTVLVLGGGAEGMLAEILRYPVRQVDYVEPDPRRLEIIEPFLTAVDREALGDPRVTVHFVDARHFIKAQRNRFDLVLAPLPEPTSASRARFYTDEFYGELRRAMTSRSVLCTKVEAAPGELSPMARAYVASIRAALARHFSDIVVGWDNPAHVLAATEPDVVALDAEAFNRRYARCGEPSPHLPAALFEAMEWRDPDKIRSRAADLDQAREVEISTDLRPIIYVQRLALWDRLTRGAEGGGRMIERLRSIRLAWVVLVLASGAGLALVLGRRGVCRGSGWAGGSVLLAVAAVGFTTMALSIVWLFAFQNLYGYVYQRIGWIVALFMAGLVFGCGFVSRRASRIRHPERLPAYLWNRLIVVAVSLAALSISVPSVLSGLSRIDETRLAFAWVEWVISLLVALTGVLGGAAFALAGGLRLGATGRPDAAAGGVVGVDHAGACVGALVTGVLLVPVYGTVVTAYLLAGVMVVAAVVLLMVRGSMRRA
jgi:spermidine synthase